MIDQSRRRRIAAGAGVEPPEVNELVKQFDGMADDHEADGRHGHARPVQGSARTASSGMTNPAAQLQKAKVGTGKRLTRDERAKLRKQREKEARRRKRESRNGNGATDEDANVGTAHCPWHSTDSVSDTRT